MLTVLTGKRSQLIYFTILYMNLDYLEFAKVVELRLESIFLPETVVSIKIFTIELYSEIII